MGFIEHMALYDGISSFSPHSHIYCEMIYVTGGTVEIYSGDKIIPVSKGEICFIPVGVDHATAQTEQKYKRWLIFINPWNFGKVFFSPAIQSLMTGLICKYPLIAKFSQNDVMERIYDEYTSDGPFREELLVSYMISILTCAARQSMPQFKLSESVRTVMDIQQYIQQNCSSGLFIQDVAKHFYLSKYHLIHMFKEHVGISPKRFLLHCRLSMAEKMLRNDSFSIAEVSERSGFASPSDMAVRFRDAYGYTPREFQRKHRIGSPLQEDG